MSDTPETIEVDGVLYVRAYPVCDGLCPHCGHRQPLWTPRRMIDAIHEWRALHGRTPTSDEWIRGRPEHPANTQPQRTFGGWNRFLAAAGLPVLTRCWWSDDEILDALVEHRVQHGAWPTSHEWERATGTRTKGNKIDRPSTATVRKRFGSWAAAREAARGKRMERGFVLAAPVAAAVRDYMGPDGSATDVAALLGVNVSPIHKLLRGERPRLDRDVADKILTAIDRPDVAAMLEAA